MARKEFLGRKGNFNGEDIIDIILEEQATARFIARHLYSFFVADEVQVPSWKDVEPRDAEAVQAIADTFANSNYDIKATLRFILNSDFFKDERRVVRQGEEPRRGRSRDHSSNRRLPGAEARPDASNPGDRLPGPGTYQSPQRRGLAHRLRVDRHRRVW